MRSSTAIESRSVSFSYENKSVLTDITFSIGAGELVALLGPNGSGKTTLLKILLGLLAPSAGSVTLGAKPLTSYAPRERAQRIAYVSQQPQLSFPLTAFELITLGRYPHSPRGGLSSVDRLAVDTALDRTAAKNLSERKFNTLSGGEKQKVLIARALAQNSRVLLLDEPTLHLDLYYQLQILTALRTLCIEQRIAVITVLHDVNLVSLFADKALLLNAGSLCGCGPVAEVVTEASIRNLLGVEMTAIIGNDSRTRYFVPRDPFNAKPNHS
jgi:iron complex transport system ATP-binding protein